MEDLDLLETVSHPDIAWLLTWKPCKQILIGSGMNQLANKNVLLGVAASQIHHNSSADMDDVIVQQVIHWQIFGDHILNRLKLILST